MPAYFTTLGEPDKRWTGKLTQIQPTPEVVNNVVLYTATFDAANPEHRLMTQMTAQVFFVTASAEDAVIVPVAALHQGRAANSASADSGSADGAAAGRQFRHKPDTAGAKLPEGSKRYWVSVVAPDGKIERRRILVGVSNRVSAEVLSGLRPGEYVIVGTKDVTANGSAGAADRERARRLRGFGGLR